MNAIPIAQTSAQEEALTQDEMPYHALQVETLYSFSILVKSGDDKLLSSPGTCAATSREQGVGMALLYAKQLYPESGGYSDHQVSLIPIPLHFVMHVAATVQAYMLAQANTVEENTSPPEKKKSKRTLWGLSSE